MVEDNTTVAWDDLLRKSKTGDSSAENTLFCELEVRLRPVLQYRLWGRSHADLDDIIQETLMTFKEKINQIESNPHQYAYTILRNKIGDALRDAKRHINILLQSDESENGRRRAHLAEREIHQSEIGTDFSTELERTDMVERLRDAILKLSDFCQTFFLAMLEGKSVQDVWKLFNKLEPNLQRSTFDKRIFDCRRKLKDLVQN